MPKTHNFQIRNTKPYAIRTAFLLLAMSFSTFYFSSSLSRLVFDNSYGADIFQLLSLVLMVPGVGIFVYLYLRGDINFPFLSKFIEEVPLNTSLDHSSGYSAAQLKDLERKVAELAAVQKDSISIDQIPVEELELLIDSLKVQLQGVVAADIIRQIENKYASKIAEDAQVEQIRRNIEISKERLLQEVNSLSRRNSLNLTIGAITTALAVGMLAYLVLGATQQTFSNLPDLLAHFIPRISVAAFIEIFSFFFLKLYKSGLQEIKYYQNELTNVEMKSLAIEATLLPAQNTIAEKIVQQLVTVDRNSSISGTVKTSEDGKQLSSKDLVDVLDKIGKILGSK